MSPDIVHNFRMRAACLKAGEKSSADTPRGSPLQTRVVLTDGDKGFSHFVGTGTTRIRAVRMGPPNENHSASSVLRVLTAVSDESDEIINPFSPFSPQFGPARR